MLYAPQRRHAVASIAAATQAIGLMQHFYTPNILVLIVRVLAQVQINACAFIHPTKSLFTLSMMLSLMNLASAFLHLLDFVGGMNGGKGIILDFVGQSNPASLTRVLLLDLLLYSLQMTGLCVSYVTHSTQLPRSSFFTYDDLLLPPSEDPKVPSKMMDDDEETAGVESGLGAGRTRRRRGVAYEQLAGDEPDSELWLDDDEGPPEAATSSLIRISDPPVIFSLPLTHVINLIFRLPAPLPPPRAFSGGTPQTTPPLTPPAAPSATIRDPSVTPGSGQAGDAETSSDVRRNGLGLGGMEREWSPEVGRIPGEYRVEGG